MYFKKFLFRDLSVIKKKLNVEILKHKDKYGNTILNYLFWYNSSLEKIKYVFVYCCKNYPSLVLEKNNYGYTILHYLFWYNSSLEKIKYVFVYCCKNYPSLVLEKNNYGYTILQYLRTKKDFNFLKYNFPELSIDTNNFILPLMMEIQN